MIFYTSNYECNRPLPIGKNKKVIGIMKDELMNSYSYELNNELILKSKRRFKSEAHSACTEEVNKIDKRLY